ncbi:MAG: asparagine synthase (glutamine-hydrolyzing) [Myxococcota bacterium]
MCGIVGIVPQRPSDPAHLDALVRKMAASLAHRGPDDDGFHVTPEVAIGMRRLSIIDVAGGKQPIFTPDAKKAIVFNGEIYNFRALRDELVADGRAFATKSDTEVALHAFDAWGEDGIRRLEGMFAVAVWDEASKTLTLARDWMGQKSIYFAETADGFAFASEIKALLDLDGVPRELDLQAASHYMSMRYLPGRSTFFAGVSKVPAAHTVRVRGGDRRFERYWNPAYQPKWQGSEADVLDGLDQVLATAVGEHLESEVPLGAFLSGGIDSSLVVAYASRISGAPLGTYSIGVNDDSQSELPWARQVAEQYRTAHFETVVEPDLASLAPRMVEAMEEPCDPLAAGNYVVSQVAAEHVTVCLGGDGGDELFAGYDRYVGQQLAELYAHVPAAIRRGVLRPLIRRFPDSFGYNSAAQRLRWIDQMADQGGWERYADSAAYLRFPHDRKQQLFQPDVWERLSRQRSEALLAEYFDDGAASDFVDKMLHTDLSTRMADHQCPIVDKMSMAHSLEVRSPFLDHRVAEYAMRIPAAWKMKGRRIKYVTRKLGERYLSRELLYRKKQGFGFPLALWMKGALRPLLEAVVADSHLVREGVFRREEMGRLLAEHVSGAQDHNYRLWMLFNLEIFQRLYIESTPRGDVEAWVDRARRGEV